MPYTKKYNRRKRRQMKRYYKKPAPSIGYAIPLTCPDKMRVRLRYNRNVALISGILGAPDEYTFRGNSIFDPDQTGTGSQPLGSDQWAGFYTQYRVMASSIKVSCYPITEGSTSHGVVCVFPTTRDPSGITTRDAAKSQPYNKYVATTGTGAGPIKTVSNYMSVGKFFGFDIRTNDDTSGLLETATGTNPVQEMFWQIVTYAQDRNASVVINADIEITYYVELYSRRPINLS